MRFQPALLTTLSSKRLSPSSCHFHSSALSIHRYTSPHYIPFVVTTNSSLWYSSRRSSPRTTMRDRRFYHSSATPRFMGPSPGAEMLTAFTQYKNVGGPLIGQNISAAMESFVNADCVCFDVDSTVIQEEGIDVLADYLGKGAQVAALTKQAMEGGMKFQDALAARLQLLQPSQMQILSCLEERPFQLTPGVQELIQTLQQYQKDVYFVSGGFRIMIQPIAKQLHIDPENNVVANQILFDSDLFYSGFDPTEPTSQDMGKPKALQSIQEKKQYRTMVMIGDGATDAQAKPPARAFIGFGGVVVREKVQMAADWFVKDFADLTFLLKKFATPPSK